MRLIDADGLYIPPEEMNAKMAVAYAPTVEAEPVRHGEWEVVDTEEPRRYGCSECKRLVWHLENYCPNCGCRMLKEGE